MYWFEYLGLCFVGNQDEWNGFEIFIGVYGDNQIGICYVGQIEVVDYYQIVQFDFCYCCQCGVVGFYYCDMLDVLML